MAYKKYNQQLLRELLDLEIEKVRLFEGLQIKKVQCSQRLSLSLAMAEEMPINTEKAVCEYLISPVLSEMKMQNKTKVELHSGESLNVDKDRNLNGEVDFLLTKGVNSLEVQTPIFCITEAKIGLIDKGIPQAAAQMYAARLKNEQEGKPINIIYGAVTDGKTWRFMKLEKQIIYTDLTILYLDNLPLLLGTLQWVIDFYTIKN